jgi:hypothetical protein
MRRGERRGRGNAVVTKGLELIGQAQEGGRIVQFY